MAYNPKNIYCLALNKLRLLNPDSTYVFEKQVLNSRNRSENKVKEIIELYS